MLYTHVWVGPIPSSRADNTKFTEPAAQIIYPGPLCCVLLRVRLSLDSVSGVHAKTICLRTGLDNASSIS